MASVMPDASFGHKSRSPQNVITLGVRKWLRKKYKSLQRVRYGLSEPAKLILGMSYDTTTIFGKIFPGRLFLGGQIGGKNLVARLARICLFSVVKLEIICFFIYKGNLGFITENEQILANIDTTFSRE